MSVDFLKKPVGGGLPVINVNGAASKEYLTAIQRYMKLLEADEFRVNLAQFEEIQRNHSFIPIVITSAKVGGFGPSRGLLIKFDDAPGGCRVVAKVIGLPVTREMVDRAAELRGEKPEPHPSQYPGYELR